MKKFYLLSAVALLTAVAATGCGKKPDADVDPTKAQLTIYTFEGGVGDQWLKNAVQLFQEKNKDRTDFENGKTGVQIRITMDRSASGTVLETADLNKDIYFTENVDYYILTNKNKLADITDVLQATQEDGKKIIDKIDSNLVDFMNRDGKYYTVPFYDCFYDLVYDKDLFASKGFYMKDDGSFTKLASEFGTGPNGVKGDWDDGLPRTYEQFASMMERMVLMQVIPFTYSSGNSTYYTSRALSSYWSDDEGFEQTNLNYTFNGTAKNIVDHIDNGVAVTKEVAITKNNGYELRSQAGVYNALHFARDILCSNTDNYRSYALNYDVQSAFINNKLIGGSNKPIAMMFEGTWWENEASNAFAEARKNGGESFRYGLMPIPKSSESKVGENATFMNLNESYGFISSSCKNLKLAKEFFAFLHTDEQLKAFTIETNMTRALKYSFTEAEKAALTSEYAKDLISIKESDKVDIVYPYSGLDFFVNNGETFSVKSWNWGTKNYTDNPIIKFIDDKSLTAEAYFNDHKSVISESDWKSLVK